MLKILIADDHPVVRQGLKQIVAEASDMVVADEASNGWEVLSKVRASQYDVVLLDISMPGGNGVDILRQLKNEKPRLAVLILSIHPEEQYAVRALKAGASGYLTKDSAPDELVAAIRKVSVGGKYVSSSLAEKLASDLEKKNAELPHKALSDREYQVMCMIASGSTVTEIANNAELTHYAIKNRLVE